MLFKSGFEKYVSGAILYEETLFQKSSSGEPMVDLLHKVGVIPGIQVRFILHDCINMGKRLIWILNHYLDQILTNLSRKDSTI